MTTRMIHKAQLASAHGLITKVKVPGYDIDARAVMAQTESVVVAWYEFTPEEPGWADRGSGERTITHIEFLTVWTGQSFVSDIIEPWHYLDTVQLNTDVEDLPVLVVHVYWRQL